jgi:hypothetical protein
MSVARFHLVHIEQDVEQVAGKVQGLPGLRWWQFTDQQVRC